MPRLSPRSAAPWIVLGLIAAFVGWKLRSSHFDWGMFARSWRTADFRLIGLALIVIQINYVLRAMRWAVFLRPAFRQAGRKALPWRKLVGSQFVGFAGIAVFGRIGELIRPLLIARRTDLSFSSQVGVVAIERVFDLGAFGLIFSLNLAFSPGLNSLPHHELFHRVGYAIACLTLIVGIFVVAIRLSGHAIAKGLGPLVGRVSKAAEDALSEKMLAFQDGLNVIDNVSSFASAAGLSIVLWLSIALAYVLVLRAFPAPVRGLTVADTILLLGFSVVGSIVQLPGVGGGAQALTIGALTELFGIPGELAVSAGLMVWLVGSMSVIPFGVLFAKLDGVSLRQVARRSENVEVQASS